MRYRPGLAPALRGVSFEVAAGSLVGVCGRTGAGKSSLLAALFRLSEPHAGSIEIDGVDCGAIGLHELRPKLALIMQVRVSPIPNPNPNPSPNPNPKP